MTEHLTTEHAAKPDDARETLREQAELALEANDNCIHDAAAELTGWLFDHPNLLRRLAWDLVFNLAHRTLRTVVGAQRELSWSKVRQERRKAHAASTMQAKARDAAGKMADAMKVALLDMPLQGGKRLREATAAEAIESGAKYLAYADDATRKGVFQTAIGQAVAKKAGSADAIVGKVFTDDEAEALRAEVNGNG